MQVQGLHHTSRTVADMERSLSFYRDLLGLRVMLDTEMEGEMLSREVALPGARLRLVLLGWKPNDPVLELLQYLEPLGSAFPDDARCNDIGAHHVALLIPDIQRAFSYLRDRGVEFTCEPQRVDVGHFEGHWTAYCYDPDRLVVELWERPVDGTAPGGH